VNDPCKDLAGPPEADARNWRFTKWGPLMHALSIALFAACAVTGLVLVALGLPGLWVIVVGVVGAGFLVGLARLGVRTIAAAVGLALFGDVLEWWLGFRFARRYGGSRRAGWGALLGGAVGAAVGVPLPIVGSIAGALAGSFAGAALFELAGAGNADAAFRIAWGALLGRVAGTAAKVGIGVAITALGAFALLRS